MGDQRTYLDWNATTPLRAEARDAMTRAFDVFGNPSSVHGEGRAAAAVLRHARDAVAALLSAAPERIVFTSGGTEANATCVRPDLYDRILVSAVEHDSVRAAATAGGATVATVPVDNEGRIDLAALEVLLNDGGCGRTLVSVMLANNETGTIEPVADVSAMAHASGATVHCDAIQAAGKIPVSIDALGVDFLTISAHKIGGPKGVGAVVVGRCAEAEPLLRGGGQERRLRAGTENLIGIAGFGAAAAAAARSIDDWARVAELRDRIDAYVDQLEGVRAASPLVIAPSHRLPNTTAISLPGLRSDMMVMLLDLAGVAVSAGAACASGKVAASSVLAAMGAPEAIAGSAIRVSLGWTTDAGDVERFRVAFETVYKRWRDRVGERSREVA